MNIQPNIIIQQEQDKISQYPDIAQLVWDMRNYYFVNKTDYRNFLKNLDGFFDTYEDIMLNYLAYCSDNIDVAVDFAERSQFYLDTMIHGLRPDGYTMRRFDVIKIRLTKILDKYIARMQRKCSEINIITSNPKITAPKPRNFHETQDINYKN